MPPSSMRAASDRAKQQALLDRLAALYAEVDAAHAGISCPATSECCRFARTDREPFVTGIELAAFLRAVDRRGGSARPTPTPLHKALPSLPVIDQERACPMLDPSGKCSVYADRPLGCRSFFCDRATVLSSVSHAELLDFVRQLKDLAAEFDPSSVEGRPLMRALEIARPSLLRNVVCKKPRRGGRSRS